MPNQEISDFTKIQKPNGYETDAEIAAERVYDRVDFLRERARREKSASEVTQDTQSQKVHTKGAEDFGKHAQALAEVEDFHNSGAYEVGHPNHAWYLQLLRNMRTTRQALKDSNRWDETFSSNGPVYSSETGTFSEE